MLENVCLFDFFLLPIDRRFVNAAEREKVCDRCEDFLCGSLGEGVLRL